MLENASFSERKNAGVRPGMPNNSWYHGQREALPREATTCGSRVCDWLKL